MTRGPNKTGWSAVDLLTTLTVVLLAIVLTVVARYASPPRPVGAPVGLMTVELTWPLASDSDVDLWVQSPGDQPVGFLRMHGTHFDLIRDDLGRSEDPDSRNLEMAVARDVPAGVVVVDAMMYRCHDGRFPVGVRAEVRYGDDQKVELYGRLDWEGEQLTLGRLMVSKDGRVTVLDRDYTPLYETGGVP